MSDRPHRPDVPASSRADGPQGATPPSWPEVAGELDRALAVVRFLREHCPWDASQTPLSLIPHLQEEAHEVSDAIRGGDAEVLEGELGDLLLNLAFQVVLGEEEGSFDAGSVAQRLEDKMERRHPHLFGLGEKEDWEKMKARERRKARSDAAARPEHETELGAGGAEGEKDPVAPKGVLHGLPGSLEPLLRAHRIQDRVSGVGFDWSEPMGAWEKVDEELDEVKEVLEQVRHAPDDATRKGLEADLA